MGSHQIIPDEIWLPQFPVISQEWRYKRRTIILMSIVKTLIDKSITNLFIDKNCVKLIKTV